MKVLIVDDSAATIAIAKARLAEEGLEICCADSGSAGQEAAKRQRPDLILLDVSMPDISGFEVCRWLKSQPELCMIPVIFLTGSDRAEDRVRGLDAGAVDYVTKPFDVVELRARVRAALRTKRLQDLLVEYAHIDPLTGLANRRALTARLAQEWARARRHGGSLACIMADLDHFKDVNDTHGHYFGDRLLCEIAKVIRTQCRECDLPIRYGGEEFVVLLPDEDAAGAARLAERCRRDIEQLTLTAAAGPLRATASFGVADSRCAASGQAVLQAADDALYEAKRDGRNRIAVAKASPAAARP